jgi:hypothetical protein
MPQLRPALQQARASIRSEYSLKACIPPRLANVVHAIHCSGSALVIYVTSAEAAHMMRLARPVLEGELASKGLKFNDILVKVQTNSAPAIRNRTRPDSTALQHLGAGVDQVKSERIQTSLRRLVETLKSK